MDRSSLQLLLAQGYSVEQIGRRFGRHPSTVSYWMRKHGLVASNRAKHAAKGGIERERLTGLVARGMTIAQIAEEVGLSKGAVRHWLGRYGLRTQHRRGRRPVSHRRRGLKEVLVAQAGGRCALCGYDRHVEALHFHRLDPGGARAAIKARRINIDAAGTVHGIETLREEARKCVLLCSNCHAEVQAGVAALPLHLADRSPTRLVGSATSVETRAP